MDLDAQITLITITGVLIRTRVSENREMDDATQGVKLISLDEGTKLSSLQQVAQAEGESDSDSDGSAEGEKGDEGGAACPAPACSLSNRSTVARGNAYGAGTLLHAARI